MIATGSPSKRQTLLSQNELNLHEVHPRDIQAGGAVSVLSCACHFRYREYLFNSGD